MKIERTELRLQNGTTKRLFHIGRWTYVVLFSFGRPVWWLPQGSPDRADTVKDYEVQSFGIGWLLAWIEFVRWCPASV